MGARRRSTRRVAALAVLTALCLGVAAGGHAQEATPATGAEPVLRAAIHAGVCEGIGEVVYPLADSVYGLALIDDAPVPATPDSGEAVVVGPPEANAATTSVSVVPATIEELTRTPHAVNAVATTTDPSSPRACGEIGGVRVGDDLVVGVGALSPTAYAGTAWLHENPDGTTRVALFLASGLGSGLGVDPATTEVADGDAEVADGDGDGVDADRSTGLPAVPTGSQVASVEIDGGAFAPGDVTLLAGQPVVLHVYNGDDRAYRVEIVDLADGEPVAANGTGVLEFTVPSPGMYVARLLPVDGTEVLDTLPVSVVAPEDVLE